MARCTLQFWSSDPAATAGRRGKRERTSRTPLPNEKKRAEGRDMDEWSGRCVGAAMERGEKRQVQQAPGLRLKFNREKTGEKPPFGMMSL